MKYENFEQVATITKQIKKYEIEYENLSDETAIIDIIANHKTVTIRLNTKDNFYNDLALKFISECREQLQLKIGELKLKLEQL